MLQRSRDASNCPTWANAHLPGISILPVAASFQQLMLMSHNEQPNFQFVLDTFITPAFLKVVLIASLVSNMSGRTLPLP